MNNIPILRLFNGLLSTDCLVSKEISTSTKIPLPRMIKNGYLLDPKIDPTFKLLEQIESVVGISGEKANSAFHKSWSVIQNTPQEVLCIQAVVHYFTTYGFQNLGMYNDDTIYIPKEKLEIPEITEDIPFIFIQALSEEEILDRIVKLGSGIALSDGTLLDIMEIVKYVGYKPTFLERIKNRELKIRLYDFYDEMPQEPVEFLRFLIFKLTGESLLIKNSYLIDKIKESTSALELKQMLSKAPDNLASIFYRFKPLFLAMKKIYGFPSSRTFINKLRKQADTLHKPLPEDFLNSVTSHIKNDKDLGQEFEDKLKMELEKVNIWRKIRLAAALKFRQDPSESIVYTIRNNFVWISDFKWKGDVSKALEITLDSIYNHISKNVHGESIFIPPHITYSLPATEKQFSGFFPVGSSVSLKNKGNSSLVGIHWTNTSETVDLDLSGIDSTGKKIGWDSSYCSETKDILYSGDMTSAPSPNGASEWLYFKKGISGPILLFVNHYNFPNLDPVEAKIILAEEKVIQLHKNHMVNPNNIILSSNLTITKKQSVIGLIDKNKEGEIKFYFSKFGYGNQCSSTGNVLADQTRSFLIKKLTNTLDLKSVLINSGALVLHQKPYKDHAYIDLSPNKLNKNSIIDLIG